MPYALAFSPIDNAEDQLALLALSRRNWSIVTQRRDITEESPFPVLDIKIDVASFGPLAERSMIFGDDGISLSKGPGTDGFVVLAGDETDQERITAIIARLEKVALAEISDSIRINSGLRNNPSPAAYNA